MQLEIANLISEKQGKDRAFILNVRYEITWTTVILVVVRESARDEIEKRVKFQLHTSCIAEC